MLVALFFLTPFAKSPASKSQLDSLSLGKASASVEEAATHAAVVEELAEDAGTLLENQEVEADPEPQYITVGGKLQDGDSLDRSLRRCGLDGTIRQEIIKGLAENLDFKNLRPGDEYTIYMTSEGMLVRCLYQSGPLDIYELLRDENGLSGKKLSIPLSCRTVKIEGIIQSTLWDAVHDLGEESRIIFGIADIFASQIDFNTEIRQGDRFSLVVEKYFKDEQFVGYGHILTATYTRKDLVVEAFYQQTEDSVSSYFDRAGRELGASFIRSPVPVGRVSSRFTYRRKHPITGKIQPHLGVDLAAPIGTPIMAAADGKIDFMGRNGGYGKQVILSHGGNYRTYYGHLSRFKKELKIGQRVQQKEIIGYVGSTGQSTGPHLDYRISLNGEFKNPFALKFKPRIILQGEQLAGLQKKIAEIDDLAASLDKPDVLLVKQVVLRPDKNISFL